MARKKSAARIIQAQRWETDRRCIRGARVSESRERGHARISEDLQDRKTLGLAQAFNLETVHVYLELGISGDAERAALEEAIQLIERGGAAWLIVSEVDRLGRDVRDIHETFHRIHAAGGCVLIADPLLNSADENAKIVLAVLAQLADSQRVKIAKKWNDAQTNAWEKGVYPGDICFGYRNPEPGEIDPDVKRPQLQLDPVKVAKVRTATRALVDDGCSWPVAAGIVGLTVKGTYHLFANRTLIGELSWGDRPVLRDAHEAIVSASDFETINGRRVTRLASQQNAPKTLGAGVLRCAGCRHVLHSRTDGGRVPTKTYYCRAEGCEARVKNLKGPAADGLLWQAATEAHVVLEGVTFGGESDTDGRTLEDVDTDLTETRRKRRSLSILLAEDPDDQDVRASMAILKADIVRLENERTALVSAKDSLRAAFMLPELVDQMTVQDRNEAVRSVLDAVFVTADGRMFPHALGTYTVPLPSKGRSVPRAPYVPAEVRAQATA